MSMIRFQHVKLETQETEFGKVEKIVETRPFFLEADVVVAVFPRSVDPMCWDDPTGIVELITGHGAFCVQGKFEEITTTVVANKHKAAVERFMKSHSHDD